MDPDVTVKPVILSGMALEQFKKQVMNVLATEKRIKLNEFEAAFEMINKEKVDLNTLGMLDVESALRRCHPELEVPLYCVYLYVSVCICVCLCVSVCVCVYLCVFVCVHAPLPQLGPYHVNLEDQRIAYICSISSSVG